MIIITTYEEFGDAAVVQTQYTVIVLKLRFRQEKKEDSVIIMCCLDSYGCNIKNGHGIHCMQHTQQMYTSVGVRKTEYFGMIPE